MVLCAWCGMCGFTCCGMVVGGSTLVQLWGTLLWPRVIGPDMVKWWFSWVWSDDISFTFGAVGVQLVVVRWFSKGYDVVQ